MGESGTHKLSSVPPSSCMHNHHHVCREQRRRALVCIGERGESLLRVAMNDWMMEVRSEDGGRRLESFGGGVAMGRWPALGWSPSGVTGRDQGRRLAGGGAWILFFFSSRVCVFVKCEQRR
ncbi:unnamed protein product [Linum trigynum]|uniref:Uncharacterized protein n=1 Tax=Linum trigynum TaxID=586398 RepID=A0AAV2GLR0_9ROSI